MGSCRYLSRVPESLEVSSIPSDPKWRKSYDRGGGRRYRFVEKFPLVSYISMSKICPEKLGNNLFRLGSGHAVSSWVRGPAYCVQSKSPDTVSDRVSSDSDGSLHWRTAAYVQHRREAVGVFVGADCERNGVLTSYARHL